MLPMGQQQDQPLHWDSPRSRINVTLIVALLIAAVGLIIQPTFVVLGLALAAYSWLTTAKQFLIYENALVIIYGQPRSPKVVHYPEISQLEMVAMPTGALGKQQVRRLLVHQITGRRIVVSVQNVEEFRERLDEAMRKFSGSYDEEKIIDQSPDQSPDQISDQNPDDPTPY